MGVTYKVKMKKLFNPYNDDSDSDYYNRSCWMAGDWLKVIILYHLKRGYISFMIFRDIYEEESKLNCIYIYELSYIKFYLSGLVLCPLWGSSSLISILFYFDTVMPLLPLSL